MERKPYVRVELSLDDDSKYQPEYLDYFYDIQVVFPEFPPETYELAVRVFLENFILEGVDARHLGGKGPRRIHFQVPVVSSLDYIEFYIFVYRNGSPTWFGKFSDPGIGVSRADLALLDPSSEKWFFAAYMMKCSAWDEFCQKSYYRFVLPKLVRLLHRRQQQTNPDRLLAVYGITEDARFFAEKILGDYLNDDFYYSAPIAELSIDDLISGKVSWKQVSRKLQKTMPKVVLIEFPTQYYRLDKLQAIKRQIDRLRNFSPGLHTTYIFYGFSDFLQFLQGSPEEEVVFAEDVYINLLDRSNDKLKWD